MVFPAAQTFLKKDEAAGGFTAAKLTGILLRNPALASSVPCGRITPDTAVALLISGRASVLWQTYDFARLDRNHWRELFLHANPDKLPDAVRPFVENGDGTGFSDDELLAMARKCHALINFLNPNKVPFGIAYELYQTGRADLLWRNYPFASLDKSEWRMILSNPSMRIPDFFLEVARSGRFTVDELCESAILNDRLLPILLKLDIAPGKIVDVLLACQADYIWEHYHFSKFTAADLERLILGLRGDSILKPMAMAALRTCRDLTEAQVGRIVAKNPAYAPYVPISAIAPDVAIDLLAKEKGSFLWEAYDFKRLNDDQWLRLLGNTTGFVPELGKAFLQYRAGMVDNARLNGVLSMRRELIEFVDANYIDPELAVSVLMERPRNELWNRFDFMRFDAQQLMRVIKNTDCVYHPLPVSLQACFKKSGEPFQFRDLLEIAATSPRVVIAHISLEWAASLEDGLFEKLVTLAARNDVGIRSLRERLTQGDGSWNTLPVRKLKLLLKVLPELRFCVGWDKWAFRDIAELAKSDAIFEKGLAHPFLYFLWKHFKSLFAMGALTAAALVAICLQNAELRRQEAERQRLNSIVQRVRVQDQNLKYGELKEFWATVASKDRTILMNDLFVKSALARLADWEVDSAAIESGMSRLREMSRAGWGSVAENAVETVIGELEKSHVGRYAESPEFQLLRDEYEAHRKQEAERKRIQSLRDKLADIGNRLSDCGDIVQLKEWREIIDSIAHERELKDEVMLTSQKLSERIDKVQARINAEKIAQEVGAISNAVIVISENLKKSTAMKDFPSLSTAYFRIKDMPGFDEYGKLPCHEEYDRLSEAMRAFEELKQGVSEKSADAKRLDEKFSKEFMTVESGVECSNIVSYCEAALKVSKEKGWISLSDASQQTKDLIERINARDKRCWSLVDQLNGATDFPGYSKARTSLIKEFGRFKQLEHLNALCDIEPKDLNRAYKETSSSWLGRAKDYKYHFVGVIRLEPESPSNATVHIGPRKTTYSADLYVLEKSSAGDHVTARKFLSQQSPGMYYKVSGVDYSRIQGMPLFVRSEHYVGKED